LRRSRKNIGLDAELVEELKNIARKRGISIAGYMRQLLDEALRIEAMGYYAPRALSERRIELVLSRVGFVYIPSVILNTRDPREAEEKGEAVGRLITELGADPVELVELIGFENQVAVSQGDNMVLLPQDDELKNRIVYFIRGLARGAGLVVQSTGSLTIISLRKPRIY